MQTHGEIKTIENTQQVNERFTKREFVLITDQNTPYPQTIVFELLNDNCGLIDKFTPGDNVSVDFMLRGRQWTDNSGVTKTFNQLIAWKIQKV